MGKWKFLVLPIVQKSPIKKNMHKCQNLEKTFFCQFKRCDDMSMFGWKYVSKKYFEHLIILTTLLLVTSLPLSTPREKMTFFDPFFTFNKNFRMFGQQVLTKLLSWKESPNFPLHDPNFGFFISLLVMKIFCFEKKSHEG